MELARESLALLRSGDLLCLFEQSRVLKCQTGTLCQSLGQALLVGGRDMLSAKCDAGSSIDRTIRSRKFIAGDLEWVRR